MNLQLLGLRLRKLARISRSGAYRSALRAGVVAGVEHERTPFDANTRTVIDVGAARGQFALMALERFSLAHLYCFEPLPDARCVLARVVGDHATIAGVALGSADAEHQMHVAEHDDSSSLLPIGERQSSIYGTRESTVIPVPVRRLDAMVSVIERPSLLKIDVQGFELEVLRGAVGILPQSDQVYVECSFVELYEGQPLAHEVVGFLGDNGFRLAGVYGIAHSRDGLCIQADFLFRRGS